MLERMHPDCPPDAHKVIRPPENELKALLCVRVSDDEVAAHGAAEVTEMLRKFGETAAIMASNEVQKQIKKYAAEAELKPSWVRIDGDGKEASLIYDDGGIGESMPFYDFAPDPQNFRNYLDHLGEKCLISVDLNSMLILRSISTVYPWDRLLAGDFVRQYLKCSAAMTENDFAIFNEIRYGQRDAYASKKEFPVAYDYLRLERKLFLQYPSDED